MSYFGPELIKSFFFRFFHYFRYSVIFWSFWVIELGRFGY